MKLTDEQIEQLVEKVMAQAQVFASAWSLVGGPFDDGDALETAEVEKHDLHQMFREFLLAAQPIDAEPVAKQARTDALEEAMAVIDKLYEQSENISRTVALMDAIIRIRELMNAPLDKDSK